MAIAPKTKSAITGIGFSAFINFDGHGKTATEITQEVLELVSFPPLSFSRETKEAKMLKDGSKRTAAGSLSIGETELKFLLNTKTMPLLEQLQSAMENQDKCEVSIRTSYPWGEDFIGNYTLVGLERPEMSDEIVQVSAKFSASGTPTRMKSA